VNATYSDLDFVGASNVPPANPRFWAHVVAVYVVSAVALLVRHVKGGGGGGVEGPTAVSKSFVHAMHWGSYGSTCHTLLLEWLHQRMGVQTERAYACTTAWVVQAS
jgi:hypothetical protein